MKNWMMICGVTILMTGCGTIGHKLGFLEYRVGSTGPGGGVVFYDDELDGVDDLPGARFLEAAPADLDGLYAWGGSASFEDMDGYTLGSGAMATASIVLFYPDASYAANACDALILKGHADWFLPSLDALKLMYSELKMMELGDFSDGRYLSAANDDPTSTDTMIFENGSIKWAIKDDVFKVRPIRMF